MKSVNFCIYEVRHSSGNFAIEIKTEDSGIHKTVHSVGEAVEIVMAAREGLTSRSQNVTVDFKPYHKIEMPCGTDPRRCFPLGKQKRKDFWNKIVALENEKKD